MSSSLLRGKIRVGDGCKFGNFSVLENITLGKNCFVGNHTSMREVVVGDDSKIWNYCNLYECEIGGNTQIGSYTEIKAGVKIGQGCRFQSYVFLPEGSIIGNSVFIGPKVAFLNDKNPTIEKTIGKTWKNEPAVVEDEAVIGGGAIILPGVRIGRNARIGAGAVVTKDVGAEEVYYGNPARLKGNLNESFEGWR